MHGRVLSPLPFQFCDVTKRVVMPKRSIVILKIWHYVTPPMEHCDARAQHIPVGHRNSGKFDITMGNCPATMQHCEVIIQHGDVAGVHCSVTRSLCDGTLHHRGVIIQNFCYSSLLS